MLASEPPVLFAPGFLAPLGYKRVFSTNFVLRFLGGFFDTATIRLGLYFSLLISPALNPQFCGVVDCLSLVWHVMWWNFTV